ncbi:MAG: hypothetical protein IKV85_06220, partial [Ruminococcus sp.]|nr:hypothetical protein [Ruminococcus sp.]
CISTVASAKTKGKLTMICECDDKPVQGLKWNLYRIGSMSNGKIILEGDFAKLPVDMSDISASGLTDSASTLREFAFIYNYKTVDSGNSKKDGTVEMEYDEAGVYLVAAYNYTKNGVTFISTPAIFYLDPEEETEKTIYPKITNEAVLTGEMQRFQLVKVWENDENLPTKPTEIVVDIYRNHKFYETVILSEKNNWSYSWEEEISAEWSMIERVIPTGCAVVYKKDGRKYIVENTYVPDFRFDWELNFPPPVVEETTTATTITTIETTSTTATKDIEAVDSDTTTTTTSTTTTTTATTTKKTTSKVTTTSKLPQTGQLWWPVPVMAGAGLVLIATGAKIINGSKRDEDE